MSEHLRISTSSPASIANLGAGYDCLALAVDLRNGYHIYSDLGRPMTNEDTVPEFTFRQPFQGDYAATDSRMRTLDGNLFVRAFEDTRKHQTPLSRCRAAHPSLSMLCDTNG
jgi:homoserine kinase